jgi:diguanylate cyclase (GGDEF)-like protein
VTIIIDKILIYIERFLKVVFLKAVGKNIILKKTLQIMGVALITGLIFYYAVTRILIFDMENSLIRYANQGAAIVSSYVHGRLSEARSISANSIISNTDLPIDQRLEELRKQLSLDIYRRLSIADAEGNSITTDGVSISISDREYFKRALAGESYVSDPFKSRVDSSMVITCAVPMYNEGNIVGVLYATYDAEAISTITDQIKLSDNGYTFIINKKGDIIAHQNRQLVYDIENDIRNSSQSKELSKLVELEHRMIAGESGTGEYYYNGEMRYMGFCPIDDTGWSIAVTAPKSAIFSKLNIVSVILLVLILTASFVITFIIFRTRRLKNDLLRHQVNTYRIADFTNLIALSVKRDGTIVSSNRYAEDLLLYFDKFGPDKVQNLFELLSEENKKKLTDSICNESSNDSNTSFELALSRGDSKTIYIYCNAVDDKDKDGIIEILGIDITQRVVQENILQDSFEELTVVYDELAASEETIRQLAYKDQLTGLPNRAALFSEVEKVIAGMGVGDKCALLYLDLDNFKYINDSFSHSIGDMLLAEIGRRIRDTFVDDEMVARFEGDEFVVFVKRIGSVEELDAKITRAMRVFEEPFNVMRNHFHVSASCGICIYPDHASSIEDMMKSSDVAMYHAKKTGKNTHIMFRQEMNDEFAERMEMENGLRRAIENDEFILYYQPQVDLATGSIVSFEALLRWVHSERGIIPPLKFINVAEETGLIVQIGKWVLKTACDFIVSLNRRSGKKYGISVNISVIQLMQADFVSMVEEVLKNTGLEPSLLELEITESKLIETVDANLKKLYELREIGVRFSIDDFGKGFSSLSYLKQLPVNTLKIDKSFVDDIPDNDNSMIESIIHIGHKRNLLVVAEGVEKKEQFEYLAKHKCDMVQGYYCSKPVPEEKIKEIL